MKKWEVKETKEEEEGGRGKEEQRGQLPCVEKTKDKQAHQLERYKYKYVSPPFSGKKWLVRLSIIQ